MKRGEIWWAQLPPPAGRRPVVLVTRAGAYAYRDLVTVVPLTTRIRGVPAEVLVGPDEGLDRECVANADVRTTLPKRCLSRRLGALGESKSKELDDALRYSLGLG